LKKWLRYEGVSAAKDFLNLSTARKRQEKAEIAIDYRVSYIIIDISSRFP
jgi:hypothetical protein